MVQDDRQPAVLLVEGEVLVRLALADALESTGVRAIPVVSAVEALLVLTSVAHIRAAVIDVGLSTGGMDGFDLARKIRSEQNIGVVVVSGQAAPELDDLPADVYVLAKPFHRATLVQLVSDLTQEGVRSSSCPMPQPVQERLTEAAPDQRLTRRHRDILDLLVQGKSNRDIAQALGLSENTVKVHMTAIFRNLRVSSRTEAALVSTRLLQPH